MKRFFLFLGLFFSIPVFGLPLGPESRREAQLFNDFFKAVYAQRAGDPNAFKYLQQVLEKAPTSKYIKRLLVSSALAAGQVEWAEPYADYISQGENDTEDLSVYAAYQLKKGNLKEAQSFYAQAIEKDPDDQTLFLQYILSFAFTDIDVALEQLLQLAEKHPDQATHIYTEIGVRYARMNKFSEALLYYDKALQANPRNPVPRYERGRIFERESQYFLMLHEFEELEKMGYGDAGVYSRMGSVFLLVKDFPKAESYFLKAKAEDNGDIPTAYFLSLLAESKGEYSKAISYLKDAENYEKDASKWLQVSFYLKKLNQSEASLQTLKEAYSKFTGNVEVGFFYALALNDAKEYKKAARVLADILKTNPDYQEARLHYAYTLESLKKYKKMEEQLEILLAADEKNAPALNLYAYSLAQRGKRLEQAQRYIARALAENPQDNAFIDTQAWVLFKMGNLAAAADLLASVPEEVIQQNPEIAYHKGAVLFELGEWSLARKYLEMAISVIPEAAKLHKRLPVSF